MVFGRFFHCMILEPEKVNDRYRVYDETKRPEPDKDIRSKLNQQWKNFGLPAWAEKKGINFVTKEDWEKAIAMCNSVMNHEPARILLKAKENRFEQKIKWKVNDEECTGVIDIDNPFFIADFKTARSAYPPEFKKQVIWNDYWIQGGMYVDGSKQGKDIPQDDWKDYFLIAVEKEPPYLVSVNMIEKEFIAMGINRYRLLVDSYKIAKHNLNRGYEFWSPFGEDGIFKINVPTWMNY